MMAPRQELRSSKMDTSLQVGAPYTGRTTSRLDKKIRSPHSIENSNILPDLHKSKKLLVSGVLMVSNRTVLFKENLAIAGS